jgi:hypothetical protein
MTAFAEQPSRRSPSLPVATTNFPMKNIPLLILALVVSTCLRAATPQLMPVSVELGLQKFVKGDTIVIHEVLATSPQMDVGDTVVVRGHYVLQSQERANLGLSLTQIRNPEPTKISPAANTTATSGHGDFELTFQVNHVGCLHLTFSSLPQRKSFGTVYFGTPEQLERVRDMRW